MRSPWETQEPHLLSFFRESPAAACLLNPDNDKMWREELLQGHGQIDFVFRTGRKLAVTEIESPNAKIFKQGNEFTAPFHHAVQQVDTWMRGFDKASDHVKRQYGISGRDRVDRSVVIGRSKEIDADPDREERWLSYSKKGVELYTWDDIVERGRRLAKRFRDPPIDMAVWS